MPGRGPRVTRLPRPIVRTGDEPPLAKTNTSCADVNAPVATKPPSAETDTAFGKWPVGYEPRPDRSAVANPATWSSEPAAVRNVPPSGVTARSRTSLAATVPGLPGFSAPASTG